ncbi:MAG: ArnT family glycosyltransferase [Armatimonadota bacterium]
MSNEPVPPHSPSGAPSKAVALAVILLIAALLRYGILASAYLHNCGLITYKSDDYEYHTLAVNLLREHRFHLPDPRPGWQTRRTPGFPLFLAGIYAVTGPSPYRAAAVLAAFSVAACAVTYSLGRTLFGPSAGVLAALAMALCPSAVLYAGAILTDTLHALLLALAMLAIVNSSISPHPKRPITAGAALGAAILVRPASVYLPAVMGLTAYACRLHRGLWLWMPLTAYAVVLPWCTRNLVVTGRFHLSTIGEYNLVSYNLAYVKSATTGTDVDEVRAYYSREAARLPGGLGELARREARTYWRSLLANQIRGALKFWTRPGSALWRYYLTGSLALAGPAPKTGPISKINHMLRQPAGTLVLGQSVFGALTALAAFAGMVLAFRQGAHRGVAVLSAVWCAYYALVTGPIPADRYHLPVEPILSIFAGHAVTAVLSRICPSAVRG